MQKYLRLFRLWLAVVAALLCAASAHAITITPFQENVEVMMEAIGANSTYLFRAFGLTETVTLAATTETDEANGSFSFALNPGSTYLGQNITLQGSGQFNTVSGLWELTSSGQVGATAFNGTGSGGFAPGTPGPAPIPGQFDWEWGIFDYHSTVQVFGATSTFSAQFTISDVIVAALDGIDRFKAQPDGSYDWEWRVNSPAPAPGVGVGITGGIIPGGPGPLDDGLVVIELVALPEPSTALLVALGFVGISAARRRTAAAP